MTPLNNIVRFPIRSILSQVEFVTHEEALEIDFATSGHPDYEEFAGRTWKKVAESADHVEYVSLTEDFYCDRVIFKFEDYVCVNKQTLQQAPECFGDITAPMEFLAALNTKRSEEEIEVSKAIKEILEYSSMDELYYELEALKYNGNASRKMRNIINKIISAL